MGLLEKRNLKATPLTALRQGAASAVVGAVLFLVCSYFKWLNPIYRAAWRVTLPIWCLLCGIVAALWEWQVPDKSNDDDPPDGSR
jgi:peptidoglycan/LPS O-acetylase OafA/YrhL